MKSEFSASIGGDPSCGGIGLIGGIKAECDIMSMNFGNGSNALAATTTTMATSVQPISSASSTGGVGVVPQIINVNQYTNQTYVINNISGGTNGMGIAGLGGQNYANSYYGWPASNYNPEATNLSLTSTYPKFNQMQPVQSHLQIQPPMHHQIQQQLPITMSSSSSSSAAKDNLEDSLGSPFKEMIKTIHECYQRHLSPTVLLKKDFIPKNSSFNSTTNSFTNNNRLAIGYQNSSGGMYSSGEAYGSGDSYYTNLHEIAEHFRFYATNLASFLHEISGKFLPRFYSLKKFEAIEFCCASDLATS